MRSWLTALLPAGHRRATPRLSASQWTALRLVRPTLTPANAELTLFQALGSAPHEGTFLLTEIIAANRTFAGIDALRFAPPLEPNALPGATAFHLIEALLTLDDALAVARRDALASIPA